jgi:phosphatidylserine/phosphatidylglycerophosphate/cardiolipin synthase-like enzyme
MPDDSMAPILTAIEGASKSILVKMFVFSEPALLSAIIAARKRGVHVRVMLNAARRTGKSDNAAALRKLKAAGVEVLPSSPAFDVTHEKSMVIDGHTAFVKSLNWQAGNMTGTRDYAIVTSKAHEVNEIMECFEADWARKPFKGDDTTHLIWCVGNGRERIGQLIDGARESLFVQNERYQDSVIIERLVRAARKGVEVRVMARPPHKLKQGKLSEGVSGLRILADVGVEVRKLKHLKLHGKMLLADRKRAIVGSINFAPGSFDSRRELAIEVDDEAIVTRLCEITHHDWKHSSPLDLSDAGLLAELGEHEIEASEELGLCEPSEAD